MYNHVIEHIQETQHQQVQCIDFELLKEVFCDKAAAPELLPFQKLLLALIEDGQRYAWHGRGPPVLGVDACAQTGSGLHGQDHFYCWYLFPLL